MDEDVLDFATAEDFAVYTLQRGPDSPGARVYSVREFLAHNIPPTTLFPSTKNKVNPSQPSLPVKLPGQREVPSPASARKRSSWPLPQYKSRFSA